MKSLFNSHLLKKSHDADTAQGTSSTAPTFYHLPASTTPATTDSYSHTSNSTAGYTQRSAYPSLPLQNHEREKPSLLGRIESTTTSLLGNLVGEDTAVSVANKLNSAVTSGRPARELLRSGTIVQLLSKSSGHLLQVVMSSSGSLVFDGTGAANSFNTYFTIEEGEKGRLRFHNNHNYLAFHDKQPSILSLPPGPKNNPSIDFRIHDILGSHELVAFESCAYKNCFICISSDGHLKTTHLKEKTIDAQFTVIPVPISLPTMSPHPAQPYQQFQASPYASLPSHGTNPYASPPPPAYLVQPTAPPAPPPSYAESTASTSSSLYPKFN